MATDSTATRHPSLQVPAASVPGQARAHHPVPPACRIVRQVQAVDAWVAARREREQALHAPRRLNRDERMDVAREMDVLRRTHDVIRGRCARALDAEPGPMRVPGLTAVIAHRHEWFADRLALLLGTHGVTVLVCTDNGAEALGTVVAEQPDIVLAGERLAMMPGPALLAQSRLHAPSALLAAEASDQGHADSLHTLPDLIFPRHHTPGAVADAVGALLTTVH